jgi:hypothetical protein
MRSGFSRFARGGLFAAAALFGGGNARAREPITIGFSLGPYIVANFVTHSHTPHDRCVHRRPRNTRYQAARSGLTWAGLSLAGSHQLGLAHALFDPNETLDMGLTESLPKGTPSSG